MKQPSKYDTSSVRATVNTTDTSAILLALLARGHDDGGALQAEHAADLVFQIPAIGKVEQLLVVAEHHKVGRADAHLGHVVDLQAAALVRGGLHPGLGIGQDGVEHTGGDAHGGLLPDIVDQLKQAADPLAGHGGDEHNGGVGHIAQVPADVLPHTVHGLAVLFHQVPLVHHNDAGLSGVVGQARHLGVLLGDAVLGVDHNEAHVAALNGHGGPEDAVFLDGVVHLGLFAHTGGVDEVILAGGVFKVAVDGVPGGTGHVADDDPLLAQDPVGEAGLAHVGLADDGHLDHVAVLLLVGLRREVLQAGVQQVAGAVAVDGGHGDGVCPCCSEIA